MTRMLQGTLRYSNGDVYEGSMEDGKPYGEGEQKSKRSRSIRRGMATRKVKQ